jgi:hypothetical protein
MILFVDESTGGDRIKVGNSDQFTAWVARQGSKVYAPDPSDSDDGCLQHVRLSLRSVSLASRW